MQESRMLDAVALREEPPMAIEQLLLSLKNVQSYDQVLRAIVYFSEPQSPFPAGMDITPIKSLLDNANSPKIRLPEPCSCLCRPKTVAVLYQP